jgi:cobaltochelatase CobS
MSNYNPNIRIPTSHRSAVRQLATRHANFESWRTSPEGGNGVETRKLLREDYLRAIWAIGAWDDLLALLATDMPEPFYDGSESHEAPVALEESIEAPIMDVPAIDGKAVLDALRPFVGDMVLGVASEALAPLVAAANRIPQTVEVERIVYQPLAHGQKAPLAPLAHEVEKSTLGKLFKSRGKYADVPMAIWNAMNAPRIDPLYVPEHDMLGECATALARLCYIWLAGPSGSGKTTIVTQLAAVTRRPFVRIAFNRATEPTDLVGMDKLDGTGAMVWSDGVLTKAIRNPGTIILLDEITFCPPGIAAKLQTLLDERYLTIETTGEVVHCAKDVYFVCADNTRGYGDETGLYAGTMQANAALVNRFGRMIIVDYMDADKEAKALSNKTGAPRAACEVVTEFVAYARKLPGFANLPISLRNMKAFVDCILDKIRIERAFDMTFLAMLPDAEREALRQAFRTQFKEAEFQASMTGAVASASVPASDAKEQISARNAFDKVETN